jgi:hypothetical protein
VDADSGLTGPKLVVTLVESLIRRLVKSEAVETSIRYVSFVPEPADHVNVGVSETSEDALAGLVKVGAPGGSNSVVNDLEA